MASFFLNLLLDLHFGVNPTSDHPVPIQITQPLAIALGCASAGKPNFPPRWRCKDGRKRE
jgi:hypothetical protein